MFVIVYEMFEGKLGYQELHLRTQQTYL